MSNAQRDSLNWPKQPLLSDPYSPAARRDMGAFQRIRSKPSAQRFTVEATIDIIHQRQDLHSYGICELKAPLDLLLRHPVVSMPNCSAIWRTWSMLQRFSLLKRGWTPSFSESCSACEGSC